MGRWRTAAAFGAAALGCALGVGACSGSSSSGVGGGADGGDGGDGSAATYTLDDVCERTAPQICAMRKSCCEQSASYDEAGCVAHDEADCAKDVADVRAGRATFHPEIVDGCLARLRPFFDSCYLTFDILYRVADLLRTCRAFEGQLPEGAACERSSQCASPADAHAIVGCDTTTKLCKVTRFLGEGAACTLASGLPNVCDEGLYCDVDPTKSPASGTCKKATPKGSACDAAKAFDLECGFGSYCDGTTKVCTAGKSGGAPCQEDLECASVSCVAGAAGKTCKPPGALVEPEECSGP